MIRIQRVADCENESLGSLSGEILNDVALTNKLLRLVNTAQYSGVGRNIGTVSRAVALIGFSGIRNMAMSLVLLEHMQDKAHANQLKEDFLRSLMAGMLASELGALVGDSEVAFIGAMFQNLGRMLTEFCFPEEAQQVRTAVCVKGADTLITDAIAPNIAACLPPWYRQSVDAPAFLLLPILLKGAPFALIYADKAKPGALELGDKELSLLRI